jgi:hypothetical protein
MKQGGGGCGGRGEKVIEKKEWTGREKDKRTKKETTTSGGRSNGEKGA